MLAKLRAVSKMAQFLSILPPEMLPPNAIVCTPPPKPTTQGLVAGGATANAVATGIFEASTVVLLVVLFEPSPLPLAEELAEPPEPPCALLLFVLDEFPELVNVELPLFFTADDPPVLVAEPPVDVLVEFPPVAL